ncbi:hypothetical protein PoB_003359000 [Plakobranchus ocellatus]|uniref:Uncharacterized protein n=1 Tax=Plakobranchus ocellatus TaxID=259542 RepID=A0AAV4AIB6_9GAST|nr:hypothetical protein PoB_003359000 [Plakobranchus ocellatus]
MMLTYITYTKLTRWQMQPWKCLKPMAQVPGRFKREYKPIQISILNNIVVYRHIGGTDIRDKISQLLLIRDQHKKVVVVAMFCLLAAVIHVEQATAVPPKFRPEHNPHKFFGFTKSLA